MSSENKSSEYSKMLYAAIERDPNMAIAVAAIKVLTSVIERSKSTTRMELEIELRDATDALKNDEKASISLVAGCDLFGRYVTRTSGDIPDFFQCKASLIERGHEFATKSSASRQSISQLMYRFIGDDKVVLVHGFSRVVIAALVAAARRGKYFKVVTTEARPNGAGYDVAKELLKEGIPVTVILDAAVGYYLEHVDFVLLGAEGVVENGGIINKIGSYQLAVVAKTMKTPVYVAAESYKFARLYPLSQKDVPQAQSFTSSFAPKDISVEVPTSKESAVFVNPSIDYTPPEYITLLFTDLGILTPSAVSDELIKLYL